MYGCEKAHRLYLIGERGISSGVMADQVDPDRTNANLPFLVQREELLYGVTTLFVAQTVGAANALLRKGGPLPHFIDHEAGFLQGLAVAQNLGAIADTAKNLAENEARVRKRIAEAKITRDVLPHTQNLRGTINQVIAHMADAQEAIVRLAEIFYPRKDQRQGWSQSLEESLVLDLTGDCFNLDRCIGVIHYLRRLRDYRNSVHHKKVDQEVIVTDYDISPNGDIIAPTIEVKHPKSGLLRVDTKQFIEFSLQNISQAFETLLTIFCDTKAVDFADVVENHVVSLPDGELQLGSRYAWRSTFKESFAPKATIVGDANVDNAAPLI